MDTYWLLVILEMEEMMKTTASKFNLFLMVALSIIVLGALGLTPKLVEANGQDIIYTVEQGDAKYVVMPLTGVTDVATFYKYSGYAGGRYGASSDTELSIGPGLELEKSETSILFLYVDQVTGDVSLIFIHDRPEGQMGETPATGGHVAFDFSGIPDGTTFAVKDDPGEDPYSINPDGTSTVDWNWAPCCTDGGSLSGSLNGFFEITIDPSFISGIDEWEYLDGELQTPVEIELDPAMPVTIKASRAVSIDIKPGSFPNSINTNSKGRLPVAILTTSDFDATTIDPATVVFAGASPVHYAIEDVDDDGDMDMILHFKIQETDIVPGDTETSLTGMTYGGVALIGFDSVRTMPEG
jgi:hypothetical protein